MSALLRVQHSESTHKRVAKDAVIFEDGDIKRNVVSMIHLINSSCVQCALQ